MIRKLLLPTFLSLFTLSTHAQNVVKLGNGTGISVSTGDSLVFIGDSAGRANSSGSFNTFLGTRAGFKNRSASDNTFVGTSAGRQNTTGTDNTYIGARAGMRSTSTDNTFIGTQAGYNNTSGSDNTFIGEESGLYNTTGRENTFIGEDSGYSNETGNDNTFVGSTAGRSNQFGIRNTALGNEALYDVGGTRGSPRVPNFSSGIYDGSANTAVGDSAGTDLGTGYYNTFIGQGAGAATEYADFNTFVGAKAGWDNNRTNVTSNANRNTYLGFRTGYANRAGEDNAGVGAFADFNSTIRSRATFIGAFADVNNNDVSLFGYSTRATKQYGMSMGNYNDNQGLGSISIGVFGVVSNNKNYGVGIGYQDSVNASGGVGIGYYAAVNGDSAIALGTYAKANGNNSLSLGSYSNSQGLNSLSIGSGTQVSGDNSIAIGYSSSLAADNEVYIGNAATVSVGGVVNWTATSDGRMKAHVLENVPGLDFIKQLRPVTYQMDMEREYLLKGKDIPEALAAAIEEKKSTRYSGFIAQEVEASAKELGYEFSGVKVPKNPEEELYGLRYAEFVVPLVKAVQELNEKLSEKEQMLAQQKAQIEAYEQILQQNAAMLENLSARVNVLELEGSGPLVHEEEKK